MSAGKDDSHYRGLLLLTAIEFCRQAENKRFMHHAVAHPHQTFPIERIEKAVNSIPRQDFSPEERSSLTFGVSQLYWYLPCRLVILKLCI